MMKKPTHIAHPLKNRSGSSQGKRSREALSWEYAPIDGKTLGDRLDLIGRYAKLVNFHEVQNDLENKPYQHVDNWTDFFENSLPFQLSKFSKTSTIDLHARFSVLLKALNENPSATTLAAVLNFICNEILLPVSDLYPEVVKEENSFSITLLGIINSSFNEPLKNFIALYNASVTFLCVSKRKFDLFSKEPWKLRAIEIFKLNNSIQQVKKGKPAGYVLAGELAEEIFDTLISGFSEIIEAAPNYIQESLVPVEASLQQKHEPHLALMFAFLEIFKHLQGNINELGKKHLDFFYKKVLKIMPKDAMPDKAHLVFEIAKHLDNGYLLPEGLLLKDGKDVNKQDIEYALDQELVLNKAQIKELRSLSFYPIKANDNKKYIEGIYGAPVANSLDGKGEKFKGDQKNWATLGDKFSKQIQEGNELPEEHPKARMGFVLSSPVLLLQEGRREVKIILNCDFLSEETALTAAEIGARVDEIISSQEQRIYYLTEDIVKNCSIDLAESQQLSLNAKNYLTRLLSEKKTYPVRNEDLDLFFEAKDAISCLPIFNENDIEQLKRCLGRTEVLTSVSLFKVSLSGEKEWIPTSPEIKVHNPINSSLLANGRLQFEIGFVLEPEVAAVTFYDEVVLKEKIDLKQLFPLVKIELNEALKTPCPNVTDENDRCVLRKKPDSECSDISAYDFLQKLSLVNAKIEVKVCGVKDLIVQNDDNLQDVNKPIMPFGPRPKVGEDWFLEGGANFYIGSKEVFCKNWDEFWINTTWKDKPSSIEEHYKFYNNDDPFEDASITITDDSFRFLTSVLEEGIWRKDLSNKFLILEPPPNPELFRLFESNHANSNPCFKDRDEASYSHRVSNSFPEKILYVPKSMPFDELDPLTINSRKGFLRLTLAGVSFQHDRYTYVLARQMMALSGLLDPLSIARIQKDLEKSEILSSRAKRVITEIQNQLQTLLNNVNPASAEVNDIFDTLSLLNTSLIPTVVSVNSAIATINNVLTQIGQPSISASISGQLQNIKEQVVPKMRALLDSKSSLDSIPDDDIDSTSDSSELATYGLEIIAKDLHRRIVSIKNTLKIDSELGIPMEPYTPLIKSLSIDYTAKAEINDMEIVHLYPFENTSKHENIEDKPTLLPYFDEEGVLFIGLESVTPGGNLSLLFQLAEATADSEMDRAEINWHYLANNNWQKLRPDFDIINDATDGLTVSGIVTIAVPDDISENGHTIMPDNLFWLKVSARNNVKAVAETIGIHAQAALVSASLGALSDKERLDIALPAGSISKPVNSDFNVKKVEQLYASFGGRKPEASGHFYVRVSEHLKHKGRGVMIADYEKIVLESFPEIYKVKCISHTMGLSANEYKLDLEVAPGYVIIAVIPDLTKLKSGNLLTPKVPISLLEKIGDELRKKVSPFARIKVMSPRFEPVHVDIEVRLHNGKSSNFYATKLKEGIVQFLAPWYLGDSEKLAFGQDILFSDVVGFIEQQDYVDFIVNIELNGTDQNGSVIHPLTARSILTGGKICVKINEEKCIEVNVT